MSQPTPGYATADGTRAYAAAATGTFRQLGELSLSSVGIGTYLGAPNDADDQAYEAAIARALERGINVVDTAVNYRHQRSERCVGRALVRAFAAERGLRRDQVVVATKGGFLSFDGDRPSDPRAYVRERFLDRGLMSADELVRGSHCMTPAFIADQLATSRRNLGLDTIDIYYLHNPEIQLTVVDRDTFRARVRAAFEALERAVSDGHVRVYGTATWSGYRVPAGHREHLDLAELVAIAAEVGGPDHHFRVVQLPYNMALHEAFTVAGQRGDAATSGDALSVLEAAAQLGVYAMCSASIYQGKLADGLSRALATPLPGFDTDAQRALQFARSTPGIGTALVGMKSVAHVDENASVAEAPLADTASVAALLHLLADAE